MSRPPPALFALVFVSGASGLMFEIVWIRAMGVHFGTTAPAIATVLAAFMAGLALGSLLFGPWSDRHARPLQLYRGLELGIAVGGLAVSLLLLHGDALLARLAQAVAAAGGLAPVLRGGIFAMLMLLPTTLMGGTLPVLSRALVRSEARGQVVGTLYAINTAGAVVGVLLPDLLIVPAVGLTATAAVAASGNLSVALAISRLAPQVPVAPAATPVAGGVALPWAPVVLFAVSGLCAMGYEVLWSRVLAHWVPGQITSFSVLLGVFLVFLSIGSAVATRWADRAERPLAVAATLLVATSLFVVLSVAGAGVVPQLLQELVPGMDGGWRAGRGTTFLLSLLDAAYLEAIPCLLMGASFPYLAAATVRAGAVGRATGRLYAINTLAGVVGSTLAAFGLLGWIGVQGSLLALALVAGGAGLVTVIATGMRSPRRWALAAALGAALVAIAVAIPEDHLNRSLLGERGQHIVEMREGATTTAAVVQRKSFGQVIELELYTPGVSMSSTSFGAQRYMSLMAQVPLMLSEERSEALLICYGAGNTARSLLAHPGLERLDVVDLSPEVLALSGHFAAIHGADPLDDPRVEVHVEDGRQYLLRTGHRYDVITSEPPPPTDAGVVNLYTREYYALARERLKPAGVLAQWLPLFQLSPDETQAIIAAFVAEFPHAALFRGYQYQWFLVGSAAPLTIEIEDWAAHAALPGVAAELRRVGVRGVGDLLAAYASGEQALAIAAQGVRPVTDDLPILQYPTRALFGWVEYPAVLDGPPGEVLSRVAGGEAAMRDAGLWADFEEAMAVDAAVWEAVPYLPLGRPEARELAVGTPLFRALSIRPGDPHVLALLLLDGPRVDAAQVAAAAGVGTPAVHWVLAREAFYGGRFNAAMAHLERVEPGDVGPALYWLLRGATERGLGYSDAAAGSFGRVATETTSEQVQSRAQELVAAAGAPFPPALGPLVVAPAGG